MAEQLKYRQYACCCARQLSKWSKCAPRWCPAMRIVIVLPPTPGVSYGRCVVPGVRLGLALIAKLPMGSSGRVTSVTDKSSARAGESITSQATGQHAPGWSNRPQGPSTQVLFDWRRAANFAVRAAVRRRWLAAQALRVPAAFAVCVAIASIKVGFSES